MNALFVILGELLYLFIAVYLIRIPMSDFWEAIFVSIGGLMLAFYGYSHGRVSREK